MEQLLVTGEALAAIFGVAPPGNGVDEIETDGAAEQLGRLLSVGGGRHAHQYAA
jgi:hypothetical protein